MSRFHDWMTWAVNGSVVQNALTLMGYAAVLTRFSTWLVLGLLVATVPAALSEMRYSKLGFQMRNWRSPDTRRRLYLEYVLANDEHIPEKDFVKVLLEGMKECTSPGVFGAVVLTIASLLVVAGLVDPAGGRAAVSLAGSGITLGSLKAVVRRQGPLEALRACDYVRQAALGLQHALGRGVTHRDVKPSNLLLCSRSGAVKVLDLLEIGSEVVVASAHRTPKKTEEYASTAEARGVGVLIAAAGGAAALPGVLAASSALPVIGVPIAATPLGGMDALLSIVQLCWRA